MDLYNLYKIFHALLITNKTDSEKPKKKKNVNSSAKQLHNI